MLVMLMSAVEESLRSSLCRRQITWPLLSRILMRRTKAERQAAGNGGDPPRLRRLHPLPLACTLRPCSRRGAPDGGGWGAGWRRARSPRSPCRLGERAGAPGSAVPPPDAAAPPLPGSYKPPRPASVGPKYPPPSWPAPPAAWSGTPISAGGCRSPACSCRWPWWSCSACLCAMTWMPIPTG